MTKQQIATLAALTALLALFAALLALFLALVGLSLRELGEPIHEAGGVRTIVIEAGRDVMDIAREIAKEEP